MPRSDSGAGTGNQRPCCSQSVASAGRGSPDANIPIWRCTKRTKIRFRDIQAQPRKIISSPMVWSHVSYNAGYTNVHELIPWRTLSAVNSFIRIIRGCVPLVKAVAYRPPIDTRSVSEMRQIPAKRRFPEKALNFLTPRTRNGAFTQPTVKTC